MGNAQQSSVCDPGLIQAYIDEALEPQQMQSIKAHLKDCKVCQEEFETLQELDGFVLDQISLWQKCEDPTLQPSAFFENETHLEAEKTPVQRPRHAEESGGFFALWDRFWRNGRLGWAVAFAMVLLVFIPKSRQKGTALESVKKKHRDILVLKGWSSTMFYAKKTHNQKDPFATPKKVSDGTTLYPRDLLQFRYHATKGYHMMILGMNDKGEHFPLLASKEKKSIVLRKERGFFPQGLSFQMDDYVGKERYFVFISNKSFGLKQAKTALSTAWKKYGSIENCKDIKGPWEVKSWWIQKKPLSSELEK